MRKDVAINNFGHRTVTSCSNHAASVRVLIYVGPVLKRVPASGRMTRYSERGLGTPIERNFVRVADYSPGCQMAHPRIGRDAIQTASLFFEA